MNAILLAAGFGTRLRPLTDTIPKCLVPIGGIPLLQIWLQTLDRAGVECFLINTHYLSEQVVEFVEQSPFKERITMTHEEQLLGTAGTLYKNIDFFNSEDGMLIHVDNFCLENIKDFINAHHLRPQNCFLTIMAFRTEFPSTCGIFETDKNNVVIGFHEKVDSPPGNLANGAVYILSKKLIKKFRMKYKAPENFSTDVIPKMVGKIFVYETVKPFLDIGTPENYRKANEILF